MKGRRSKLELILDVLESVMGGTEKPTTIMYEANLSWKTLNENMSSLASQGLIETVDESQLEDRRNSRAYRITGKGVTVVRYYRDAERLIKVDEQSIHTRLIG